MAQFKIGKNLYTIFFTKKSGDWEFGFRRTKLEEPVIGITSKASGGDFYKDQKHIGIFDFDDILPLEHLVRKTIEIQLRFPEFVGDGYIYETSPKKYSLHFYNHATYWDWMKVVHFCNDCMDPSYVRWRLFRNTMVMRFSPKSNGYVPKLVRIVRNNMRHREDEIMKVLLNSMLEQERKQEGVKAW